jgi:hypothetical protein
MTSTRIAARAALIGFGLAVILAALAFYETSAPSRDYIWVFLGLCPPSIFKGLGKLTWCYVLWFWIALIAGLYAASGG